MRQTGEEIRAQRSLKKKEKKRIYIRKKKVEAKKQMKSDKEELVK